jgi:Predicted ATPases of PP-loop superfamily
MKQRVLLSWSSGKDSAWTLYQLQKQEQVELCGLLTTFNGANQRVAMHAVRRELVEAQAEAAGLPLWAIDLPYPCSNEDYESRMQQLLARARAEGITHIAFGDLFLEDVRAYRERMMSGSGIDPLFPLWGMNTRALAEEMLRAGLRAIIVTVDPRQLSASFAARPFDALFLKDLPASVDPCGERGEFHTFCFAGPMFRHPIPFRPGQTVTREGFVFTDLEMG